LQINKRDGKEARKSKRMEVNAMQRIDSNRNMKPLLMPK
jgi:hypothetical protein